MILDRWAPRGAIVSSPPPARPLAPGAAEGLQGVEDAGQAFFPGAFALEAGLDGRQGQRGRAGGEPLGSGSVRRAGGGVVGGGIKRPGDCRGRISGHFQVRIEGTPAWNGHGAL